jgi:hypothetical protein
MLGTPPICATAVIEHVFQSLVEHLYQYGNCYMPNIGWLYASGSEAEFVPCDALEQTLTKLSAAIDSRTFSFANIESVMEAARRANTIQATESR